MWKNFPFYYTLLSRSEINLPAAKSELEYTAPVLERLANRNPATDKYGLRKMKLVKKAFNNI
jgi:hypothetical protein